MIKVFSTQWFKKYQSLITRVARLPILGELIFNFKKFGHYVDRNKICEVTPNSVIEFVSWKKGYEEVELRQHFFVRNEYALRLQHVFYPIWITFHIWDIITRPFPQLNLGFDTLTVYPDASSGATTSDGYTRRTSVDETFSTIRAGDGNNSNVTGGSIPLQLVASTTENQYFRLARGQLTFDTSALTSGATISNAVFSGATNSKANGLGEPDLHLCVSNPTNDNNCVNGDYQAMSSTTSFGSISYADFSAVDETYNDITLNASGLSAISKTGITKLGLKLSWDILNSTTGVTWASSAASTLGIYSADYTVKPKLVVTYTTVVGPANLKTYNTNLAANIKSVNTNLTANIKSLNTNV